MRTMMLDYPTGVLFITRKGGDFISDTLKQCPVCKEESYWFRNENGSSSCITCADKMKDAQSWPKLHSVSLS